MPWSGEGTWGPFAAHDFTCMIHSRVLLCLSLLAAVTIAGSTKQGPAAPPASTPPLPAVRGRLTVSPEALESIRTAVKPPAGFTLTAFATPPVVNYPTCVTATHDGVVFVCVDRNRSLQTDPGMGYVVRLVDTDQNGQADEGPPFLPRWTAHEGPCSMATRSLCRTRRS